MIIEEIMNPLVISLKPHETIGRAIELMHSNRIRHIPIIDENEFVVGIVTDRDIRDVSPSIFHAEEHLEDLKRPVASIMTENVITGHPLDFVEEVSAMFYEHKIGCLPIVTEGKLVGIITETDMLHTLVKLMGADQPSSLIEIKVKNKLGQLSEAAQVFSENNVNIISVLVYPDKKDNGSKILLFRVQTMNPMKAIAELNKRGYTVLWPNLPGVTS
ncbi:CBS-domain-containing membrane protein [Schinkia azotoformans MEV2011]|uniref:CBS-domain-containing membrane protein n=1 Tax=Schinkia azotoformans MEV2011 TaxID=1348973 RepID=A0A072NIY6_SCHAZ|nr:acetoin utilization AcuB family protein [Schinkia azotoformans]KEF37634.1 CBS-domain-containing membrane protein [Schinkia azotoformans MEV2011]MEC1637682.1 acetoin utilization AcuB family protein [Schinkia azotoformans]MEC1694655.1 acetoin utilization AcuB family protein [Schinkia azotoformans]MEC1715594.1 acetoin utilization AcuB family protein [Schinkia azotoformans]MEC1720518.1 acetoin utilization AcuB family protein [Schinkia azotoformans]